MSTFEKYGETWKIIETELYNGRLSYQAKYLVFKRPWWFFGVEKEYWQGIGFADNATLKSALEDIEKFKPRITRDVTLDEITIEDIK
tara:strand:- start:2467 stop:2727 length:261 start_codon:yes stop_codon:yes gene_type:complete